MPPPRSRPRRRPRVEAHSRAARIAGARRLHPAAGGTRTRDHAAAGGPAGRAPAADHRGTRHVRPVGDGAAGCAADRHGAGRRGVAAAGRQAGAVRERRPFHHRLRSRRRRRIGAGGADAGRPPAAPAADRGTARVGQLGHRARRWRRAPARAPNIRRSVPRRPRRSRRRARRTPTATAGAGGSTGRRSAGSAPCSGRSVSMPAELPGHPTAGWTSRGSPAVRCWRARRHARRPTAWWCWRPTIRSAWKAIW